MIKYIVGDILKCNAKIRCHQVNCKGIMGSGLAKQVKSKYPETFNFYKDLCKKYKSQELLGTVQFTDCHDNTILANMFAQDEFGFDNKQYTQYEALDNCISHVYKKAEEYNYSIAFPYMLGCVRGGGSWSKVLSIIEKYFKDSEIICYIVSLNDYKL